MLKFVIGFIVGVIVPPACAYFYIRLGYAPVATAAPPFPFERKLAHIALNARVGKEAPRNAAVPADEPNLMAGAQLYREHCAVCHGLNGGAQTATAKGMFPRPPKLMEGTGVTDDPPGESYWKIANGIRLTGMPAYGASLSTTQMWQIAQFVANADKLPASVSAVLK
jgi:mono/diheme cytochrome c family protein